MKTPIIKYNDKFLDRISWTMRVGGITLWPWVIIREKYKLKEFKRLANVIINHESIHIKQQGELLILPFYILYGLEWLIKTLFYGSNAYMNLSFEREAYSNELDFNYLKKRKPYSWVKRILK